MKTYLRTLKLGGPYGTLLPLLFGSTVIGIVFQTLSFATLAPILKVLFNPDQSLLQITWQDRPEFSFSFSYFSEIASWGKMYLASGGDKLQTLGVICITLIIGVFISNFFAFVSKFIAAFIRARATRKLRMASYKKITSMHLGYFSNENRGDLMSRLTNDIYEVETTIIPSAHSMIKEPVSIIIMFVILFSMSFKVTLFALVVLPISGLIIADITKRLRKKAKKGQLFLGKILSMVDETLYGMKIIKSFTSEGLFINKFLKENLVYQRTLWSISYKKDLASPVSQVLGTFVVAAILYYGGSLVLDGKSLAPEDFIVYILFFSMVISPIKAIASSISTIQRGLIAAERVFDIVDAEPMIIDSDTASKLEKFEQAITFENVSFSYDTEPILKNINLTIEKGTTVALVGPSGGGKSTLVELLPRFHDVQEGAIKLDEKSIKELTLHSLRQHIGVVTQESILFNDTIFNNIAFGKPGATMEDVEQAARIANAHDFILEQENGYNTGIGDKGTKLSGGQRQRLSIARAILKNPPILILDEATSALDSKSEKLVQEALHELMKNRTSIVIAHRLSTIQNADKIVVINNGEIVEHGTHDELINNHAEYFNLIKLQS